MLNGMDTLATFPQSLPAHYGNAVGNSVPQFSQAAITQVPTSFPGPQSVSTLPSSLTIHPTPHKSRVETQIPIKLTLSPLPPGITRLHLPTHTISKPKLVAKPTPERSADMLELQTMLVCTSAMQDPTKLSRAYERARQASSAELLERPPTDSPEGSELTDDDERRPLNGGPVHICDGCITRERKRAARKKSKKPEEDEIWQRDEAKRIVVFNTTEIKDWQKPTPMNNRMNTDESHTLALPGYEDNSPFIPEGAMQVDVPMRIACYCRHQSEKLGFQYGLIHWVAKIFELMIGRVIFTIKDYRDNVVAQAITLPIIITDDHKTHAPSAMAPMVAAYPDITGMRNGGIYYHDTMEGYGGVPTYRSIRSTPDLQSLQHQPYHGMSHGLPHGMPYVSMHPTAVPYATPPATLSHTTSTTLTPRNLSRQGSPSNAGGPAQKKRKASAGKLPDALTMTRLQSAAAPPANLSWVTSAPTYSNSSTAPSSPFGPGQNFNNGYANANQPRAPQSYTNPPTPNSDQNFFTASNRSQSTENFARAQQIFSAPSSAIPSRAASPVGGARVAATQQNGSIQAAVSAMYGQPQSITQQKPPMIHKLIPNEGPKAGAIEVTCLGSGFVQGLEVMFGDALATTTTFWGETSLVCLLPPALRAGVVPVTFKHQYQQQLRMPQYSASSIQKHQVFFKYVDDDEHEVVRLALALVHQKLTGQQEDASDIARRIISGQSVWNGNLSSGNHQQRQMSNLQTSLSNSANIESSILKCLDLIDLDDSPFNANLNIVRSNGQGLLHLSASLGYHQLTAALLVRGATPDMRDKNGMTPMHMAALHNYPRLVRRLRVARADPYLRNLRGFTPADMCSTDEAISAVHSLHNRSRSAGPVPLAGPPTLPGHSRTSTSSSLSTISDTSESYTENVSQSEGSASQLSNTLTVRRPSNTATNVWGSNSNALRRDSNNLTSPTTLLPPASPPEEHNSAIPSAAAAAMAAWRDQLASQITHFHNSVNWTLPNLQLPTLPTLPPLPDYGDHPMVRRISAFVPQRASFGSSFGRPSLPGYGSTSLASGQPEGRERWWDLLGGRNASLPPPYEEIYPQAENAVQHVEDKKAGVLGIVAETLTDLKLEQAEAVSSGSVASSSRTATSVTEGQIFLSAQGTSGDDDADVRTIKRLRSDRRLFMIWVCIGSPHSPSLLHYGLTHYLLIQVLTVLR